MLYNFIKGIIDIIYPKVCIICKEKLTPGSAIDSVICMGCWKKIKRNLPPFCYSCGRHLEKPNLTKNICPSCIRRKLYFDRAFSPCVYDGIIKELIHEFKYRGKDYLGITLARLLIEFIKEYDVPVDYLDFIIPIPLHKTRLREREFNQAQILSNYIAGEFNKTVLNDTLRRHRLTKTQTELEENERILNVKGSFSVSQREDIKDKNVLLVDDVLTTGATSSEAAYALKNAGANIVFVLTLAN